MLLSLVEMTSQCIDIKQKMMQCHAMLFKEPQRGRPWSVLIDRDKRPTSAVRNDRKDKDFLGRKMRQSSTLDIPSERLWLAKRGVAPSNSTFNSYRLLNFFLVFLVFWATKTTTVTTRLRMHRDKRMVIWWLFLCPSASRLPVPHRCCCPAL